MRFLIIVIILFNISDLFAQQKAVIKGRASSAFKEVVLFEVLNGKTKEIDSKVPDAKGEFSISFVPRYEGLYSLGMANQRTTAAFNKFYLKGGDVLNVVLNRDDYELSGLNTEENEMMYAWDKAIKAVKSKGTDPRSKSTYVDFFPEVESFKSRLVEIKTSVDTKNERFNSFFKQMVDMDFAYYAISYLHMPRTAQPRKEDMSAYYREFDADVFMTADLLLFPYGDRFLNSLLYTKLDLRSRPSLAQQVAKIPADVLKGQYVLQQMERARTYGEYKAMLDQFHTYILLPEQQERVKSLEEKLIGTKTGIPAYKFVYPDAEGNDIALDDLKGKLVLVDLWATWCGPCRAEEPYWEKLNEMYRNKSVAFVGISTDKDKAKWETYVKEKELKGVQLYAGSNNVLSETYNVIGIPRYILIDKNGDLITADSPRPSDSKLTILLDEWLRK